MLANVQQKTIRPIIEGVVAQGSRIHTDEYSIYARLTAWGYEHRTVATAAANMPGTRMAMASAKSTSIRMEGLLVVAALLAAPAPRHLAGEAARLPGLLSVRPQHPPAGQSAARRPRCRPGRHDKPPPPRNPVRASGCSAAGQPA